MSTHYNYRIPTRGMLLLLVLVFIAPSFLQAQSTSRSSKVQFSCVSWSNLSFPELFYRDGRDMIPLEVRLKNRSKLYPSPKGPELELYIREMSEDGKLSVKLVGKALFPKGADRTLFFITEKPTANELPLTILGIDDSLKNFPRGSFRFVNSTTTPIQVTLDEETKRVAPRSIELVKFNGSSNGGFLPFYVKDSDGVTLYENRLFGTPSGRDMVFIGPPSIPGGRVTVLLLPQLIAPDTTI